MRHLNKRYSNLIIITIIIITFIASFSLLYNFIVDLSSEDKQKISLEILNEKVREMIQKDNNDEDYYYDMDFDVNKMEKIIKENEEKKSKLTNYKNKLNVENEIKGKKVKEKINKEEENKEEEHKEEEHKEEENKEEEHKEEENKEEENKEEEHKEEENKEEEHKEEENKKEENKEEEHKEEENKEEENNKSSKDNRHYSKYYEFNDGEKRDKNTLDLFSMILPDNENEETIELKYTAELPIITSKFCGVRVYVPPESIEGNKISCPVGYVIKIHDVFFGRRVGDKETCSTSEYGNKFSDGLLNVTEEEKCESHPVNDIKNICENKRSCYIKPSTALYKSPCPDIQVYMEVSYQCVEDKNAFKKPKFAIVMFADKVKPDSLYEHSISEFAQYADIHGYSFFVDNKIIDYNRQVYYQKLYSLLNYVIRGLNTNEYEWIFWADGDSTLVNPNIKLDSFIPPPDKDDIHLVISDDVIGLNAGMFLIHVHPWSLSFLMKACTYSYYNKDTYLSLVDQSAMLHTLIEQNEEKHYVIVPQNWFNSYFCNDEEECDGKLKKGDFLVHYAGYLDKSYIAAVIRKQIKSDKEWYGKRSSEMREEVLKYYKLPKEEQHSIYL